jgi:hypothetical protein
MRNQLYREVQSERLNKNIVREANNTFFTSMRKRHWHLSLKFRDEDGMATRCCRDYTTKTEYYEKAFYFCINTANNTFMPM